VERNASVNLNAGLSLSKSLLTWRAGLRPEVINIPAFRQVVDRAVYDLMRAAKSNGVIQ